MTNNAINIGVVPGGGHTYTFPSSSGTLALTSDIPAGVTVGTTTITSGTSTRILYDNAGTLGEYAVTGSGTTAVLSTSPTFTTDITTPKVLASSNDSGALGASGTAFSDLFLASGGIINWNAAASTITHSFDGMFNHLTLDAGAGTIILASNPSFNGSSSGATLLKASAVATGSLTLPAATDTLVGKATTDTLTNKTFDTAGTGNSLSINGVAVTANTGTGAVVRATSPTLVTPTLGAASGTSLTLSAPGTSSSDVPTLQSASTLANKRIQPRTSSTTSNASLTPDLSTANVYFRTTQTVGLTIGAPIGTPVLGEVITIYVDSVSAQTLTINATYVVFGTVFPASTTAGKTFMLTAQYSGSEWRTTWANKV